MPGGKQQAVKICGLCRHGKKEEEICGKLYVGGNIACHKKCMQYSAKLVQYKFDSFGGFKIEKVQKEIARGKFLKCHICKLNKKKIGGATCGCAINSCSKGFHFYCAHQDRKALTRRIEVVDRFNPKNIVVKYRVFCGPEHFQRYEENEVDELRYDNCSDDDEDDSEDDDDAPPRVNLSQSSVESPSNMKKSTNSVRASPRKKLIFGKNSPDKIVKPTVQTVDNQSSDTSSISSKVSTTSEEIHVRKSSKRNIVKTKTQSSEDGQSSDTNYEMSSTYQQSLKVIEEAVCATPEKSDNQKLVLPYSRSDSDQSSNPDNEVTFADTPSKKYVFLKSNPTDFLIAFVDTPDLTADLRRTLKELGGRLSGLPADHILIWPHSKQLCDLMLFYLKQLTDVLSEGDGLEVGRLIFSLEQGDFQKYREQKRFMDELAGDLQGHILDNLIKTIRENLSKAEKSLKSSSLGQFIKWKAPTNGPIYVLFLLITDAIDLTYSIRKLLSKSRSMFSWQKNTCLSQNIINKDDTITATPRKQFESHSYEVRVFHRFLAKRVDKNKIYTYPSDTFICANDPTSVTQQLRERFENDEVRVENTDTPGNPIVFLGPVDHDIINYPPFVRRCLLAVVEELLTAVKEIYVLVDVGHDMGIVSWDTLMPNLPAYVSVNVSSAQDPKDNYISCVLIQFSMKTDNLDNISVGAVTDEETSVKGNSTVSKTPKNELNGKKRIHNYMREDAQKSRSSKKRKQKKESSDSDSD